MVGSDLKTLAVKDKPWIVAGDFNCVLRREEKIGNHVKKSEMAPFKNRIMQC